jgi:hypothetical protein
MFHEFILTTTPGGAFSNEKIIVKNIIIYGKVKYLWLKIVNLL